MTKLLLHFFFQQKSAKKGPSVLFGDLLKYTLQCIIVLCLFLSNSNTYGQNQVDTWFKAGRAINAAPGNNFFWDPYPLPPADGTPVSTWYDLVTFTPQDAVQHPAPADYPLPYPDGFDYPFGSPNYLDPAGSIPGLPVLRRNSTDNINFNPVVRFDGSGNGQALHFRSNSRDNITVFIVFKAEGAGNSAETQRLLFGGDMDTYHSSTTNLSLGIADGNRFSVGRTWSAPGSDYFQSGNVDLLAQPTIGVFKREVINFEEEALTTYVNGILDISQNRLDNSADLSLSIFNRLGMHFNSNDPNRNLSGDIAEVLLADESLPSNYIRRVESYLAIKYGITLYNGPQLGSIVGNDTYRYLAANGDIIWEAETTYKHDIAGIGADRFNDNDAVNGGIKLRYTLDQRISKSENADAIVTISTNTDFSEDNVDPDSRPTIPGWPTYNYNYLLWANDNGSINEIATELPTDPVGITSRIEREWRVQSNQLGGVTPISGVSVRVDLSGSDILDNGNCGIKLLIDTDTDGDFTTGTITEIPATSIDAGKNAYFENVTFNHREVFTIGYGDNTPPTASDPDPITVCNTAPDPDPTVVDDENDNCGIPTVTWIDDTSDNLSNPETIIRTYQVTDAAGNSINVKQTITIYTSPVVDAGEHSKVCGETDFIASDATASGYNTLEWSHNGNGSFVNNTLLNAVYQPAASDIGNVVTLTLTATGPNDCQTSDTVEITYRTAPETFAGNDAQVCSNEDYTLSEATASGYDTLQWTTTGDGSFVDSSILNAVYQPGTNDISTGNVTLRLSATSIDNCTTTDEMVLTINPSPGVPTITVTPESCSAAATNIVDNYDANLTYTSSPAGLTVGAGGAISNGNDGDDYVITATNGDGCSADSATFTFDADINIGFNVTTNVQHESCWENNNGSVSVAIEDAVLPVTVQLNNGEPMVFHTNSFDIDDLAPGNYEMTVIDDTGCQTTTSFGIQSGGPNLGASVEVMYLCDSNLPSNTIAVTLFDPSISNDVLYALDSTDPNDFVLSPNFGNITSGEHTLSIMHNNGCMAEVPFEVENFEQLELTLASEYVNQITANVTGGATPYTYYFDNNEGTASNTYTIDRSGTFSVRVVDSNGCEVMQNTTMNLVDISIPDFFTPNNDGQNDYWSPKNTELFPDIETYIFDRYGRKIQILGPTGEWNGEYNSKPMPSGDYWYIVKLNDGSGREFVGHFTLYR
ncbi:MAG: T9SS type B sorting domain-containing protein [Muricauda sp.]|nr:T9SS type B sorting domain-containing protein [Allomuricauda sp.]MBA4745653.1 T9SS type B sorting domain-containing protein [Allomuricauda sp.]